MSRRQTIPPFARDILADLAKRLRASPGRAADGAAALPDVGPEYRALSRASYEAGWMKAELETAAMEIEAVLETFAPKKARSA